MDLAESGFFWKVLNYRERRGDFQPIVWESCKVTAPPRIAIGHCEPNFQLYTRLFVLHQTKICKGGMKNLGICSQWRCETFLIIIILLSIGRGVMNALSLWNLFKGLRHCQRWKKLAHFAVIAKSWWIFMPHWKLISELSTNEQGGAKKLKRALTGWGTGKIAENLLSSPFNRDL
jgi:hypothetical protein